MNIYMLKMILVDKFRIDTLSWLQEPQNFSSKTVLIFASWLIIFGRVEVEAYSELLHFCAWIWFPHISLQPSMNCRSPLTMIPIDLFSSLCQVKLWGDPKYQHWQWSNSGLKLEFNDNIAWFATINVALIGFSVRQSTQLSSAFIQRWLTQASQCRFFKHYSENYYDNYLQQKTTFKFEKVNDITACQNKSNFDNGEIKKACKIFQVVCARLENYLWRLCLGTCRNSPQTLVNQDFWASGTNFRYCVVNRDNMLMFQ